MFAEDEGQPEVDTQPGNNSLSKNSGGKEKATKKQYMEVEYDTGSKVPKKLDISQYISDTNVTAEIKYALIHNRAPPVEFKFPPMEYKDKKRSTGFIKIYCQHSWFTDFDFISYSTSQDELYCTECVLFHTETHKEQPSVLIYKPYTNWKNFTSDVQNLSQTESHRMSKAKMDVFVSTYMQSSSEISFILCTSGREIVETNRRFLTSIMKCLEFCQKQRLALRGNRDDSTAPDKRQQENFKSLLDFCVNAGDQLLQEHLEMCSKKASHLSKTHKMNSWNA